MLNIGCFCLLSALARLFLNIYFPSRKLAVIPKRVESKLFLTSHGIFYFIYYFYLDMSGIRDADVEMNNTNKVGTDAAMELQTYDPNLDLRGCRLFSEFLI